ncbi:acetyl/propionyl/methylcrotonyl-CoA carboxylase subunit alpha [Williamwhitmania taraxaci]|uniref:3-methylcrotonyl-CoA carboxylase alpha subunit/acetyl-CoA/propionyl-CoA carboxylase, biotin carboxylase, biotin carboxyl carrier protein n=1 Tax=Williamwhitmania taraxaci TaxID=1640674 RepID=A0A1G6H525_9BACT|nr:biotin carboxylase N-terminal domain-containing protein [Williamwhitmania taraxaci]SDB89359.1 3-methylcrotonyl-CoA carboxylase alpha subunit/acetyl-CoA/propionyl-CoA carboxylase, biotin carboxylase, biotin carboxyl carrier protein [Williamwhitmania taraxaci]
MISRLLIANRGEIALRIMRTAKRLGIHTIAVYSEDEGRPLHAMMADSAVSLGSGSLRDTYLNIAKIVELAKTHQADAIHPGYGFLSENAEFAEAVEHAGIRFVGPTSTSIALLGNKVAARDIATNIGIPTLPGATGSSADILALAATIGFPVLVKPAGGGGGKGMYIAQGLDHLDSLLKQSAREAGAAFGTREVYIEKYIPEARHIEVQIIGDGNGKVIHLFDRECSLQRRYQKIVEEAPSPSLSIDQRERITGYALALAAHVNYRSAGTVEFLLDGQGNVFFLEMNTRIQVEHPVTEMVTSTDIVEIQLQVAGGESLLISQENIWLKGNAIEVRVYAEDSERNFAPATGTIDAFAFPVEPWLRVEHAMRAHDQVTGLFDPMLGKVIVKGSNRKEAISRLRQVLGQSFLHGVTNNIGFLQYVIESKQFASNRISTNTIDEIATGYSNNQLLPTEVILAFAITTLTNNSTQPSLLQKVWTSFGASQPMGRLRFTHLNDSFEFPISLFRQNSLTLELPDGSHSATNFVFSESKLEFEKDGERMTLFFTRKNWGVYLTFGNRNYRLEYPNHLSDGEYKPRPIRLESGERVVISPLHGKVLSLSVIEGEIVEVGSTLMIIEAMKMENLISSPQRAKIGKVLVSLDDQVSDGAELIILEKI